MSLTEPILRGERRAIARQISGIENNRPEARQVLAELYPHTGQAYLVGLTGAPGTGKSTLVNELAKAYRRENKTVAIISVDPTSPFSGGAILGDRIRMADLAGDPGVFVRSMATRGSLGGLARATADAAKVFDAAGFEIILIETVGVGQAEVEIAGLAHSVVVVEAPGLGDEVQAIKAGILEIADVFVVNKADREGASRTVAALTMMLDLTDHSLPKTVFHHGQLMEVAATVGSPSGAEPAAWRPPICKTVATQGQGIAEVVAALAEHRTYQLNNGMLVQRERERLIFEIQQMLKERLLAGLLAKASPEEVNKILEQVVERQLDPFAAVEILAKVDVK
ncbi:MAG: methylmalonyl Co-A mutase-associated GTPase MeaB [Anaerolineales bacterium]|nr:methylmalonyl Co-A mutase-associated GTPase MeaB [Anaerolineales bacterium]